LFPAPLNSPALFYVYNNIMAFRRRSTSAAKMEAAVAAAAAAFGDSQSEDSSYSSRPRRRSLFGRRSFHKNSELLEEAPAVTKRRSSLFPWASPTDLNGLADDDSEPKDRRAEILKRMENQLGRFFATAGFNDLVFEELTGGLCGFISGSMYYIMDISEADEAFTISTIVHAVEDMDDLDWVDKRMSDLEKDFDTDALSVAKNEQNEIMLVRKVPLSYLDAKKYDDFDVAMDHFHHLSRRAEKVFKAPTKRTSPRASFLSRMTSRK
jgi:hypothetical protein